MGHIVRIPVSVNFRAVLAPELIAPPLDASSPFTYDFGLRTAGPSSIAVRTTSIKAAQVETVQCDPDGAFFFNVTDSGVDYFAAGVFMGDQPAFFWLYLADAKTDELITYAR